MVSLIRGAHRRRSQTGRGAAALEFVFVAPIFFATIGFLVAIGLALLTKYRLHSAANTTVRMCTAMQRTGDTVGTLVNCLNRVFPTVVQAQGGGNLGCMNAPSIMTFMPAMVQTSSSGINTGKAIYLVKAQVSCNVSINPLTNVMGAVMPSQVTLTATSAMPFVLGSSR